MRMYKPQEIADRMIREAVPLDTDFCLAADVAALRKAQRQLELRLLDQIEKLTSERDEARYFLKIFIHAHASNNAVPPHIEHQAREALKAKP